MLAVVGDTIEPVYERHVAPSSATDGISLAVAGVERVGPAAAPEEVAARPSTAEWRRKAMLVPSTLHTGEESVKGGGT